MLVRELMGAALREVRMDRGLKLRSVSARSGVSLGHISEIERGRKEASSEMIEALCDAMEIELSQLLLASAKAQYRHEHLLVS